MEQEALDVGVGSMHGARTDSPGERPLLSRAILGGLPVRAAAVISCLVAALFLLPEAAQASQLIARNTSSESLVVSKDGKALLTYHARGRVWRVLAWGAVGARFPSATQSQVAFRIDRSGGWGSTGRPVWKTLRNACGPYRGPAIPFVLAACTAPDGSHWAIQRWRRHRANYGVPPWKSGHDAWELRLSHWRGPVAQLEVWLDWSYSGRWHHLFGRYTYLGKPVHGFAWTPQGDPVDTYGRVLSLDTLDSRYGPGWQRENGFLARPPDGTFCYGFVPHRLASGEVRPPGVGRRYRLATSGPGVTPDVAWEGAALHDFRPDDPGDRELEVRMNALQQEIAQGSKPCHS